MTVKYECTSKKIPYHVSFRASFLHITGQPWEIHSPRPHQTPSYSAHMFSLATLWDPSTHFLKTPSWDLLNFTYRHAGCKASHVWTATVSCSSLLGHYTHSPFHMSWPHVLTLHSHSRTHAMTARAYITPTLLHTWITFLRVLYIFYIKTC